MTLLIKNRSATIGVALASALGSFIFGASPSAAQVNCRRVLNERCSQTYRVDAGKATHTSQGILEAENPVTVPSGYVVVNFREIDESSQTGGGTFNVSYAARGTISNVVRQYASESSRISDYKAKVDALYQGSQGSEKAKLDILRNQLNALRSAASTSSSVNTNTDTFTLRATSQYQCTRMVFGECVDGRGGHGKGSLIVDLVFVGDNPSAMLDSIGQQIAGLRPVVQPTRTHTTPGSLVMNTPVGARCLDAAAETWTRERGALQIYQCNGSSNQQWNFSQGRLIMNTPVGARCLDAAAETWTRERGTLQIYQCNGSSNQQWNFSQGRLIMNTPVGARCLDAAAETWTRERGTLQIYQCNGSSNQQWKLR